MSEPTQISHPKQRFMSKDVEGFDALAELALDMHTSWNPSNDQVWRQLDAVLWERTQNPWIVLQTVSRQKLQQFLDDPEFRKKVDELIQDKHEAAERPTWFQQTYPESPLSCVAYFCMEYMLGEALPIYSGGLGNVAGDQLKAASDLGVPVVAVGLLYQRGYFHQVIDKTGAQLAIFPYNDPGQLPVTPLRHENGEWLRLEIELPGYSVWLRGWLAQVGGTQLYLLDSNDAANYPAHRGITSELYGGGPELRLQQELLLGIGGWRLLRALGLDAEICHMNEGHAAFAVLERARCFMEDSGHDFATAMAITRAGNIFTTHTAVADGFDRFSPALIKQYVGGYAEKNLGISRDELLALGRHDPEDKTEPFNMAYLGIRGSGMVNGVSRLHGRVSRHLFEPLFRHWPVAEVPVGHVTNGVHIPTWDSSAKELWVQACGKGCWLGTTENMEENIRNVSDTTLWAFRTNSSHLLVNYARKRLCEQLAASGAPQEKLEATKYVFDPNKLTLGFARRFAKYKRPNLLLKDPERLLRLLTNPQRPVQLILAGKAHPADLDGREMIREWSEFIRRPEVKDHVIFISDYDMLLTKHLVQGVDVWINTPRRPWEACGTSGMKVLVNGGINLSVRDGWWDEAFTPEVGWALEDTDTHGEDPAWDLRDAEMLYDILENQVIPEFYTRDEQGIPTTWVSRMRESMARLTPHYSTNRTVREYTENYYLPAAEAYRSRKANNGAIGVDLMKWQSGLAQHWNAIHFGEMKHDTVDDKHIFEVQVYLDDMNPDAVKIELFADGQNFDPPERITMQRVRELVGAINGYAYHVEVSAQRPASDYSVRIIPYHDKASVPLEDQHILWHA